MKNDKNFLRPNRDPSRRTFFKLGAIAAAVEVQQIGNQPIGADRLLSYLHDRAAATTAPPTSLAA